MHTRKFDYYSADHTWGATRTSYVITLFGENPTSAPIPACKICQGIATHERTAMFVDQRERFQLPFLHPRATFPHGDTACWKSPFRFRTHNLAVMAG